MISRRSLLSPLLLLGAGAVGYIYFRDQIGWPEPEATFVGGRASSGWLTFPPMRAGLELPARIHGAPVTVLVDSGAQYTAIDRGLAARLGLQPQTFTPIVAYGVSGAPSVARGTDFQLDLGPVALSGLRAAILDLAPLAQAAGGGFSLILGRDALRRLTAEIDFPRRRIAFHRPETFTPAEGSSAVPVRLENGGLMAQVQVEDAPPVELLVDTGASAPLALSTQIATTLGLLDGREVREARSVTLGGVGRDQVVRARSIRFAGSEFRDQEVSIFDPPDVPLVPKGLLGAGLLRRFRVALDHANGRMHVLRSA
jgi:predicted aspartyl protease